MRDRPESNMQHLGPGEPVLAFDVGGTDTKSALIDGEGRVLGLRRTPTPRRPENPADAIVAALAVLAREHLADAPDVRPVAAGVSVPGLVDERAGIGIFASNLGWRDAPIRDLAERALSLPVAFGHDVRAAGDAEHRLGAARGYGDVVVLAIGTGIAGALVLGGRPYAGGGYAGEIGHSLADPHGERCACGAIGCLETLASAGAIARRYTAASGTPVSGARDVLAAATAGDPLAKRVWDDAVEALAEALARLVAIVAPEAVVIGGGLAQAGPALFGPLGERLDALLSFHRRPALVHAELGDDAGLLGTALAARDLAGARAAGDQGDAVILTVTPNPALDLTWHADRLTPGETHRVPTGASRAGGKGLNVARVLHAEGHDVLALATAGGTTGAEFAAELEASGVRHRLLQVGAPTRRSVAIVDDARGRTSILNEFGAPLDAADSAALMAEAGRLARTARAVAVCGSLPPGVGADDLGGLVADLVRAGTRVIVDTSGPGLLAAARAGAHALKPNREELASATGHADPLGGAYALLALGAHLVVLSLGEQGLIVVGRVGAPVHARLPRPLHGNATGAGDAAVAATAAALATGADLDTDTDAAARARTDLARRATAWSASAVLMPLAGELSPRHLELEAAVVVTPIDEERR